MYDELVKRLRNCATQAAPCDACGLIGDISCSDNLMKQAADAIEELSKQHETQRQNLIALMNDRPRWIPVTERLPEHDTNCIVFSGGEVKEAHFYYGKFYDPIEDYMRYNATHWMPLPEPPKDGEA